MLKQVEPDNPGHHHRCYSNKATDRYILGGRRGTEFIDLDSGEVLWNSWVRGVCKYGVLPCNGLLYAPPHACGCYTLVKTTGFFALAPRNLADAALPESVAPPQRGPAYEAPLSDSASPAADAWPAYRHDGSRSGSTEMTLPAALRIAWQAAAGGRLSAPTVAERRVYVADADGHRLCALDATSGREAWQFTTGARIDSPPTIFRGRALFGGRDGYVYSVTTADGTLAWRVLAARADRRIPADGQLGSVSPCHGSVLLRDGVIYATAGRSSYLDSGIDLCRIDPQAGTLLSRAPIYSPDTQTGRQPEQYDANTMPGSRSDILSDDADHVYLQESAFDGRQLIRQDGNPHLFALTGMLDDAWSHRARASPGDAADRQPVVPCRRTGPGTRAANARACRGNRTRECCWPSRRPMAVCRASWPSTGPPSSMAWRPRRGGCSWLRKAAKSSVWKAPERTRRGNEVRARPRFPSEFDSREGETLTGLSR